LIELNNETVIRVMLCYTRCTLPGSSLVPDWRWLSLKSQLGPEISNQLTIC